jgi:hypothetical protein
MIYCFKKAVVRSSWWCGANRSQAHTTYRSRSRAAVKIYDTTIGTAPTQILTNVSIVPLTVGDHAMIAEIE